MLSREIIALSTNQLEAYNLYIITSPYFPQCLVCQTNSDSIFKNILHFNKLVSRTSPCFYFYFNVALQLFEHWNYSSPLFPFRHASQPLHVGAKKFGTEATELTSLISTRRQVESAHRSHWESFRVIASPDFKV